MLNEIYNHDDKIVHVTLIVNGKEEITNAKSYWEDFQDANQKILSNVENGKFFSFSIQHHGKNHYTVTVETSESYDIGF